MDLKLPINNLLRPAVLQRFRPVGLCVRHSAFGQKPMFPPASNLILFQQLFQGTIGRHFLWFCQNPSDVFHNYLALYENAVSFQTAIWRGFYWIKRPCLSACDCVYSTIVSVPVPVKVMKWVLISTAAALLFACSKGDSSISAAIADQFDRETENVVDLSVIGPPGWDRVCILTPYTSIVETEKVLGFKWDSDAKTSIGGSDAINVVVFVRGQAVLAFTEHPRNKGDFSGVDSRCVSRERAKFVRVAGVDRWTYLRDAHDF